MKNYLLLLLRTLILAIGCNITLLAQTNAPTNLAATPLTSTSIRLNWTDNATNETGFEIERSTDNRTFTKIADAGINATTFTVTGLTPVTLYYFRARTKFATGTSVYSNVASATTFAVPPVVNNLAAAAQGTTSIRLTWTDVGKEATYYLERRTGQSGNFTRIATTGVNYTDNNLTPGTEYCYRVQYAESAEVAGYSNIACATTQQSAPSAPARLAANAVSSTQIDLSWADLSGNETGFEVERSPDGNTNWTRIADLGINTTTYSNTGLNPNTRYFYRVRAKNSVGNSAYSNTADAITQALPIPNAPARLTAQAVSSSQINLTWADIADNETGFQVERASSATAPFTKIADLGINTQTYSDPNLNASTQYCYRVRAVNASGASAYSDIQCATTQAPPIAAPQNLAAATASATQINLTWNAVSSATGYQLERSPNGNDPWTKIADPAGNATSYADQNLTPNTRYFYRIRAVNQGGASGYSNTADATTADVAPNAPARLTATAISFSQINLAWADLSGNETGFQLERSTDGTTFTKIADLGVNTTTYADQGLTGSTRYYYRVRAVNAIGMSGYSNIADATTLAPPVPPPAAPTTLAAVASSSSQINLSWTDNASNETGFELERSTDGTNFTKIADMPANTTTYSNAGLNPATRYYYRIRAVNQGGSSAYSNTADATTADVAPNAPARLTATAITFSSIALAWADLSGNETGFQLERASSATAPFTKIADLGPNTTTYTDQGLNGSTPYCYRIRAVNAIGPSAYSDIACATTPAAPVPPPAAPTTLAAVASSSSQINLSWTDNASNETGFELERSTDGTNFTKIADMPANTTTYSNAGLNPATRYYYRIRAVNQGGSSAYSNTADATTADVAPNAPARLTATAITFSSIALAWADLSGNETGFQVERSTDGINFTKIADLGPNVTTYQNTGLSFLTKYYYRVRAINAIGPSGYSNTADATTLPPPVPGTPQNLTAQPNDFDRIQLNWSLNPDNPSGYVLERALSPTGTFTVVADLAGNINTFIDTGLQELTMYYYRVRARNVSGFSPYSNVASAKTEEMVVAVRKEPTAPLWHIIQLADEALIQFAPDISGVVPITIYDVQGRPRLTQTVRVTANRQVSVATSSLPGNLYIIIAETNKGMLKHKLMKP